MTRISIALLSFRSADAWGIRQNAAAVAAEIAITEEHVREWEERIVEGGDAGNCNIDMRDTMPACKQEGASWTTGVANMGYYYGAFENTTSCSDAECQIVSTQFQTECCPFSQHKGCGGHDEDVKTIAKVANEVIPGHDFFVYGGAPKENYLQERLMEGKPVMVIITWEEGGGRALTIAGCKPATNVFGRNVTMYYLHDPEQKTYKTEQYGNIAMYNSPGAPGTLLHGHWTQAILDRPAASVAV